MTMQQLTALLEAFVFVRVHKLFIVSGDKVVLIHRQKIEWAGGQIPVGRRFRP
jgi:DNA-binding LytR/AlgR family response regulator